MRNAIRRWEVRGPVGEPDGMPGGLSAGRPAVDMTVGRTGGSATNGPWRPDHRRDRSSCARSPKPVEASRSPASRRHGRAPAEAVNRSAPQCRRGRRDCHGRRRARAGRADRPRSSRARLRSGLAAAVKSRLPVQPVSLARARAARPVRMTGLDSRNPAPPRVRCQCSDRCANVAPFVIPRNPRCGTGPVSREAGRAAEPQTGGDQP